MKKKILILVTDDPVYRQSSIRVCNALVEAGYDVTMAGRVRKKGAVPPQAFRQVRLRCLFHKKVFFYAEINIRLFLFGLFTKADCICAVNLDTALVGWLLSVVKRIPRLYDARELFTEQIEIVRRPIIHRCWLRLEQWLIPRFPNGLAVSEGVAAELYKRYGVLYAVSRNIPLLQQHPPTQPPYPFPYLLYQGAVNHGRGLHHLVPAMRHIDLPLVICGDGNYMDQCRQLVQQYGLAHKIIFTGMLPPHQLSAYTDHAFAGINLVEPEGLNQYYSLPNKLFDYLHAGIPQVTMNYPEYRRINKQYQVGLLIDLSEQNIVQAVQTLKDPAVYQALKDNCRLARQHFNWQQESRQLAPLFNNILQSATVC